MISTKQLQNSAAIFIIASTLLIKITYYYTKSDSWLSVLLGAALAAIILKIYGALTSKYPGLDINQINDAVFGKIIGKILSVFYAFFFFSLAVLNLNDAGAFIQNVLLPGTPITLIYVILMLVCALAVSKGPKIMKFSTLMLVISVLAAITNALLLLNIANPRNFLPVLTLNLKNYLIAAHFTAILPFCEIFAFIMYVPHMLKPEEAGRGLMRGLLISAAVMFLVVTRDISVAGNYLLYSSTPSFSTIRLIDVGDILTRLDTVYAVTFMFLFFFKISVLYYAAAASTSRIFNVESIKIFIGVLGVLIIIYAGGMFNSSFEHLKWKETAAAPYSTFFLLVLPLVTLIVSAFRSGGQAKKNADKALPAEQNTGQEAE